MTWVIRDSRDSKCIEVIEGPKKRSDSESQHSAKKITVPLSWAPTSPMAVQRLQRARWQLSRRSLEKRQPAGNSKAFPNLPWMVYAV